MSTPGKVLDHNRLALHSFLLPLSATSDGVLNISPVHHPNRPGMYLFGYRSASSLRNAVETIRILVVNDRREYLVGIALLLVVVFCGRCRISSLRYTRQPMRR